MSFITTRPPDPNLSTFDPQEVDTRFVTDCVNLSCFGGVVVITLAEQQCVGPNQMALTVSTRIALPIQCAEYLAGQINDMLAAMATARMQVAGNA